MPTSICPRCNQRISFMDGTSDFVHECNSFSDAINNEDIVVVGDWNDYTGSGKAGNVLQQGLPNKFQGTQAGLEGEHFNKVTKRGKNFYTHRERQHLEFIELKKNE